MCLVLADLEVGQILRPVILPDAVETLKQRVAFVYAINRKLVYMAAFSPVWRLFVSVCCCSTATYGTESAGHVVQGEALAAADGCALVVVLPRREDEQLSSSTGLHALPARFGQVGEAVLLQIDKGEALLKGGTHHSLLARRDGGRTSTAPSAAAFVK